MDDEASERVELPTELYYIILAFAGRPLLSRLLSQPLSTYGSQQLDHLTIVTSGRDHQVRSGRDLADLTTAAATSEVQAVVSWCAGGLRSLDLRGAKAIVDDALIAWLLQALPGLRSLDVSHAGSALSPSTLALFRARPALAWRAADCWRMHSPHPSLSARDVLTIQIEALRGDGNSGEGVAQCFAFASPGNRRQTGPVGRFGAMLRQTYSVMLSSTSARIACVQEISADEDQPDGAALAVFLVSFREEARQPTSDTWLDAMYDM